MLLDAKRATPSAELKRIIETYLSSEHCGQTSEDCPVAALASEVAPPLSVSVSIRRPEIMQSGSQSSFPARARLRRSGILPYCSRPWPALSA
jgi:hypothetical protein